MNRMTSTLTTFDQHTAQLIAQQIADKHWHIAQRDLPVKDRKSTARNYDSSITAFIAFMTDHNLTLPTRGALEQWRDSLLRGGYAVRTVNAKLSAVRKLLRAVADDVTDIQVKMVLRDWSNVADAKTIQVQDKTEGDYGLRLTLPELQNLIDRVPTGTIKGLRDRALIAVMAGAGLRVSEAVALTLRDVFLTENESGQRGIKVRHGKHNKSRVVVLNDFNSWVVQAVDAYTAALDLTPLEHADVHIFRGVRPLRGGGFVSLEKRLSERGAQRAINAYTVEQGAKTVQVNAHDLRRTFAKLCRKSGMSWDALREQMGHSSVKITEKYVGLEVDWSERKPGWSLDL